jgi:RNA polymerase sigma-70 factor (ECF subfamily)
MHTTSVSLLQRLQHSPSSADWRRFAGLYTPLLFYWAHQLSLQDADAEDLVQEVLSCVWKEISNFQRRDGKRFRGWLWTITLNYVRRQHRRRQPSQAPMNGDWAADIDSLNEMVEEEYQSYLVQRAMQLMRAEFEPSTYEACWEFVAEARPASEVAAQLGLTPNAVYLAKARVLRRLREVLDGLID